ncbi:MAG: ABC transporter substrate-binding protein, partial [Neglectibacter timonensis]
LNCTLKVNWIGWAEYPNKYPLLFSSGEKFDMAYAATWLNFASLAQKGAFMSLDELWPKYAPKNFERQSEAALRQATVEGHYYCIPTLLATYSAYGPIYRTDILEGTDWDGKMENLADFEAYLGYVKKTAPQFEPYNVMQSGSEVDDMYMREQGMYAVKGATNDFLFIDPNETDPKIFTYYEYEKTPDFLEMMNRWNEAGYFTKSALSDTDSQKFKNGIAASTIHNIDSYSGNYIDHPDWGVKYANFVKDVYNMPFTQDTVVISNTSENPERALALYDLITNDEEAFRAFYYGIEDTSYEIIDGQIKNLDADNYAFSACWAARTTEFNLDSYGAPADLKTFKDGFDEYIKEKNGEGGAKYAGFAINTSSIETEYAACQNVHQQYWWPLELGYTDAESGLKDYQAKMEAAGIEKVREVIQGQLEEYIASLA